MALAGGSLTVLPDSLEGQTDPLLEENPLDLWDDNGNGWITCAEARRHGIAPVPREHPAYIYMRDGDGDGCGSVSDWNRSRLGGGAGGVGNRDWNSVLWISEARRAGPAKRGINSFY